MISSTHDLPPRGNYFAESAYLTQNLGAGTLHNRGGARMLALTDDFLVAVLNTLQADEMDGASGALIRSLGRDWGRRAAEQFAAEMETYYGRPLPQQPLAMFAASLTEAFRHHGWGSFRFDFSRYAQGLIAIEVRAPIVGGVVKPTDAPADKLLAAFLAGMFSHFASLELDCVQTEGWTGGVPHGRFLLTVPERLAAVAPGRPHDEIVEDLSQTTMNDERGAMNDK